MTTKLFKYPRTPHFTWSPGTTSDDRIITPQDYSYLSSLSDVLVSEKRDGEGTTLYPDGMHARSRDSLMHPSRNWVKRLQGEIGWRIPHTYRVCGENLYARHSIGYDDLTTYFEVFSIWDLEICLSWDETVRLCQEWGLTTVPVLYRGPFDENLIKGLMRDGIEGYVVRNTDDFDGKDFSRNCAKYVRKGHVQCSEHWMYQEIVPNRLRAE